MITKSGVKSVPHHSGLERISSSAVCGACTLNAETAEFIAPRLRASVSIVPTGTRAGLILDQSIILFMAYRVTSEFRSNGICVATTGSLIPVSPKFSITKPATADPTAFGSSATSLFNSYIGFSTCSGNAIQLNLTTDMVHSINATSNLLRTKTLIQLPSTTSPSPTPNNGFSGTTMTSGVENISPGFTTKEKAATGVVVPVVIIIAFVLGMIYLRRFRRKRSQPGKMMADSSEDNQPYLQRKAELDAQENRRLELEATEVRYEMDGGDDIKEMSAWGNEVRNEIDTLARPQMPSLQGRHELRGEDCSKELEVP